MKKCRKRIFGLLIFALLLYFSVCSPVVAEEVKEEEEDIESKRLTCLLTDAAKYQSLYDIDIDASGSNYTISLKLNSTTVKQFPEKKQKSPSFKVSRVLLTEVTDLTIPIVKYYDYNNMEKLNIKADTNNGNFLQEALGKELSTKTKTTLTLNTTEYTRAYIVFESTEPDTTFSEICGFKEPQKLLIYTSVELYPSGNLIRVTESDHAPVYPAAVSQVKQNEDVCANYETKYSSTSFEYVTCKEREIAKTTAGTKQYTFNLSEGKEEYTWKLNTYQDYKAAHQNENIQFQCDAFSVFNKTTTNTTGYDYANKNYLVGDINSNIVVGKYKYNYGGQKCDKNGKNCHSIDTSYQKTEDITCNVKCTEVVTVEYGAPVASKAGMCFEYQVKVTSRVLCDSSIVNPPTVNPVKYCNPSATCWNPPPPPSPPATTSSEGPNEDFDSCVRTCDGGKYSAECSRTCYDEVYNNNITFEKNSNIQSAGDVEKLVSVGSQNVEKDSSCDGIGYFWFDKTQSRSPLQWTRAACLARTYVNSSNIYKNAARKSSLNGGGIPCAYGCTLRCKWTLPSGCTEKGSYLNPGEWEYDVSENDKMYNAAKEACTKYSKCTTETATFTMNVDYDYTGSKEEAHIYFPYFDNQNNSADQISYNGVCTKTNSNTTIINSAGCYSCEKDSQNNFYQTEWGLPGTWIKNKTGAINYGPPTGENANYWQQVKSFCLPLDTKDVNQRWWNDYFIHKAEVEKKDLSYLNENYMQGIDEGSCGRTQSCAITKQPYTIEKYNIHASTGKFGMFEWDINVDCFYALNSQFPKYENGGSSCSSEICTEPYTIHSADLTKLFPSKNTDQARSPGFNWSQYSLIQNKISDTGSLTLSSLSKEDIQSPYAQWVQELNYKVYDDKYLDYKIELTKDKINELKKSRDYTDFDDEGFENTTPNGTVQTVHYRSPLFRGANAVLSDAWYPDDTTLKCNNIGALTNAPNYPGQCLNAEEEVNK